jgi:phosphoribosyl 1,2-cyclic phosphodiesterase
MKLTFWGTRGSIAVPGPDTLRYGGNTTCLCLDVDGQRPVVLDAGTGIRRLGMELAQAQGPLDICLLITHLHWDHLMGFLFFEPAYRAQADLAVGGWPKGMEGLRNLFDSRRSDGNFPVTFGDLPARIQADDSLRPPRFRLGEVRVTTTGLNHPQGGIGFRFQEGDRSLVFLTDNELHGPGPYDFEHYVHFCQGADVLVHDAQYLPQEMSIRRGWGHSDWSSVVELANQAGVGRLILTHHDPGRTDEQVEQLTAQAKQAATRGLLVEAAYEGMALELAG